jgi:hypothetical protein
VVRGSGWASVLLEHRTSRTPQSERPTISGLRPLFDPKRIGWHCTPAAFVIAFAGLVLAAAPNVAALQAQDMVFQTCLEPNRSTQPLAGIGFAPALKSALI